MAGIIAISKLKPHPKNGYYFSDVEGEKYEEIKRSIAAYGIRDPLKVTTSYTVISGHQRLRIAKELQFTEIPVEIVDVDEWQAEYLLIAENVERRGQAETDAIKKARIAQFLKEYWGVKNGNNQFKRVEQNAPPKTLSDVGDVLGENRYTTKRLLKLNDLIPEIQALVSARKLGTTAAEQLAYLSPDEQRALLDAKGGDGVADMTVADAKDLRKALKDAEQRAEQAEQYATEQENEAVNLRNKLDKVRKEGSNAKPHIVEKEVVKEVVPEAVKRKMAEIERERDELSGALATTRAKVRELERLEVSVKNEMENPVYDMYRSLSKSQLYLQVFTDDVRKSRNIVANTDKEMAKKVMSMLSVVSNLINDARNIIEDETTVKVVDVDPAKVIEINAQ